MPETSKVCSICGETKVIAEFVHKKRRDKISVMDKCTLCYREIRKNHPSAKYRVQKPRPSKRPDLSDDMIYDYHFARLTMNQERAVEWISQGYKISRDHVESWDLESVPNNYVP